MNRMHKVKCILFGFFNAKIHISGIIEYFLEEKMYFLFVIEHAINFYSF
jgi:hypothetical protein